MASYVSYNRDLHTVASEYGAPQALIDLIETHLMEVHQDMGNSMGGSVAEEEFYDSLYKKELFVKVVQFVSGWSGDGSLKSVWVGELTKVTKLHL